MDGQLTTTEILYAIERSQVQEENKTVPILEIMDIIEELKTRNRARWYAPGFEMALADFQEELKKRNLI